MQLQNGLKYYNYFLSVHTNWKLVDLRKMWNNANDSSQNFLMSILEN